MNCPTNRGEPIITPLDDGLFEDPISTLITILDFEICSFHPKESQPPSTEERHKVLHNCGLFYFFFLCVVVILLLTMHFSFLVTSVLGTIGRTIHRILQISSKAIEESRQWNDTCLMTFTNNYAWYVNHPPTEYELRQNEYKAFERLATFLYNQAH